MNEFKEITPALTFGTSQFQPVSIIARMWVQPRRTVLGWIERSQNGTMQKNPLPEGSYYKDPATSLWMLSLDGVRTKTSVAPIWSLEEVLAGKDQEAAGAAQ